MARSQANGPLRGAEQHLNPYADEKVDATFFYPEGYQPNLVAKQVKIILAYLDWLDTSHVESIAASWGKYAQADGLYIFPKPTALASHLGLADCWTNFGLLTEQAPLAALATQRNFTNWRAGELGPDRYRLAQSAMTALQALEVEQPGDVLVCPAQTGKLFAGRSVRNARFEIEHAVNPLQWPLPAYVVGWMIFANQYRLTMSKHLAIDCPGDEYRFVPGVEFAYVLCFSFDRGKLCCDNGWIGDPIVSCGSASGFAR